MFCFILLQNGTGNLVEQVKNARRDAPKLTILRFSSSHSTRGSWMNASRTLINESLLSLNNCIVISQAIRKTPSTPVTPNPSIMFCVRRKGTRSGTSKVLPFLSCVGRGVEVGASVARMSIKQEKASMGIGERTFSNRQLKSTCTTSPVLVSRRIFSQCRSPSLSRIENEFSFRRLRMGTYPRMNPTIDITAAVRPYVNRLESHADGSGKVSTNHS